MIFRLGAAFCLCAALRAQTACPSTPQYSPCDLVFQAPADNPIDLEAEFRSPRQNTSLVKAFHDSGRNWIIRFAPAEAGAYAYRTKSNAPELNGKEGQFTATPIAAPGWLRAANVHHFALVEGNTITPHLWMGAVVPGFASMSAGQWKELVDKRAPQHFTHLGVTLVDDSVADNFRGPDFFRKAEEKIRYANQNGIIIDVCFFAGNNLLNRLLPSRDDRHQWFSEALARLAAFNVTWQGVENWESYDNGRDLLKEIADFLNDLDPYKHPRSSRAAVTTGALADDGWLRYRSYETGDDAIGAIEQQVYQYPAVNNFSNGVTDTDTFRHHLWNATMNGQYPSAEIPNEQAAAQMKVWYQLMADARHWEMEPYYDAEGLRGLALDGVEYLIYVEKPQRVTVHIEDHGYDGAWFNPITGQFTKIKDVKGTVFTGEPPDSSHDWVLRISREGHKAGMLKSYKFDSRPAPVTLQEIEGNPEKVPFDVVEPSADTLSLASPPLFSIKLKRESKALEHMLYEWTGEVTVDGRLFRVIGTGASGTFRIPSNIARNYPAALHVKVLGINGLGKVYTLDRNYTLNK
jgi:hypothetical protein